MIVISMMMMVATTRISRGGHTFVPYRGFPITNRTMAVGHWDWPVRNKHIQYERTMRRSKSNFLQFGGIDGTEWTVIAIVGVIAVGGR